MFCDNKICEIGTISYLICLQIFNYDLPITEKILVNLDRPYNLIHLLYMVIICNNLLFEIYHD